MSITLDYLRRAKKEQSKFCSLALYDATFARLAEEAGVEVLLVGDSLGNMVQGHSSTLPVRISDMVYHTRAVARGCREAMLMVDLPYLSYSHEYQALATCDKIMSAGAQCVKLECLPSTVKIVESLCNRGIPVCAHIGLTPQLVNKIGGYKIQGVSPNQQKQLLSLAQDLSSAGADLLLLECVKNAVSKLISEQIKIPIIGIGAGPKVDGQVLVIYDLLGMNTKMARFAHNFLASVPSVQQAMESYVHAVKNLHFPAPENCY